MKVTAGLFLSLLASAAAWTSPASMARTTRQQSALKMALDYNDPVVAEEFANVQPMTWEEVEAELNESGIPAPQSLNDMELKLMLVEMRLRLTGRLEGDKPKARPTTFKSPFEEAIWTKPAFAELYKMYEERDDHNSMNVIKEMMNIPDVAKQRYTTSYPALLEELDLALNAPPPVNSPTIAFSGFPSNMGEAALKMTLEALGAVAELECEEDDSFPILRGKVTFEDIESAKACVAQYNGMDMGMGTLLEMSSV
mmetsp:Transcript_28066/g.65884  ORF Transcript_28066/g.65884 Transcript_28066/m.65884 type:complete len:254 (-) Transcript_28066:476-1237(-)